MKRKSTVRAAAASAAAVCVLCVPASPAAAHAAPDEDTDFYGDEFTIKDNYDSKIDAVTDFLYWGVTEDLQTGGEASQSTEQLPEKFDLRDVDGVCYVPEIRNQTPFGTCWSFGAIAASEISIVHDLGLDFNTMTEDEKTLVDLSEKHLAWFSYTALSGDPAIYGSQVGEGYHFSCLDDGKDSDEETLVPYNWGGFAHYASVLFSELIGPALECDVPYLNKDGTWELNICRVKVDENGYEDYYDNELFGVAPGKGDLEAFIAQYEKEHPGVKNYDDRDGPGEYYTYTYNRTEAGDWSLDESERFQGLFLKESNILPSPAVYGDDGYCYNEAATTAIKNELLKGRGVAINLHADQTLPGDWTDHESSYLNFLTADGEPTEYPDDAAIWAHYTYDQNYDPNDPESWNCCISADHAVCIVGYDDTFPKEYFKDPKGTIGGDGAWIVRNSWGSADNSDPTAVNYWGNGGDGYFWVSYYDQSLDEPETYEFLLFDSGDIGRSLDIYDMFPLFSYTTATCDTPVYMANVYTAESWEVVRDLGIMTALPELNAKLSVYLLNDGASSPTDGVKVSEGEGDFEYKGYHTVKLDNPVIMNAGQKYSVVLQLTRADGMYVCEINSASNKTANDAYREAAEEDYIRWHGSLDGFEAENSLYAVMIVNRGESFLGAVDGDKEDWKDLRDIIDIYNTYNTETFGLANLDYDNFPIRSYPYAEILQLHNNVESDKKVYDAGDVIKGTIVLKNESSNGTYEDITITCTLTDLGDDGKIAKLEPGESRTIDYSYTVTEDDLGGELTSELKLQVEGYDYTFIKELRPEEYVFTTADRKPVVTEYKAADAEPADSTVSKPAEPPVLPIIIISVLLVAAAAAAVMIVVAVVRPVDKK